MKIGIISNFYKDNGYIVTMEVVQWLNKNNIKPYISVKLPNELLNIILLEEEKMMASIDYLIIIGGDGTLLTIATLASENDVHILGINLGTVGFLTTVERNDIGNALKKLITKDFKVENRIMLEYNFLENDKLVNKVALNDFVVTKGVHSKIISLEIWINNVFLGNVRGDGLIISTPTGSTAYNFSANGPILQPTSRILVLTPICPHGTFSCPFVISANDSIKLKVSYRSQNDVALVADGSLVKYINDLEEINISTSKNITKLINIDDKNFFELIRYKLGRI